MIKSKLPNPFWAEAIESANKVRNRLPTRSLARNISPHQAWFGKRPSLKHLRQFGCVAYHRIPDEVITKGAKPDPRGLKCCFLGYIGNRLYRLWNPEDQKLIISRHVVFSENEFLPISAFGTILNSTLPLQTPFDHILDDEDPDISQFSVSAPATSSTTIPSQQFVSPRHPAAPKYLPAPVPTIPTSPNPYALLAPIPPVPTNTNPNLNDFEDSDSDSDSDNDDIPNLINNQVTPLTEQSIPVNNQSQSPSPPSPQPPHLLNLHPLKILHLNLLLLLPLLAIHLETADPHSANKNLSLALEKSNPPP